MLSLSVCWTLLKDLIAFFQVAPQLVKSATSKPVHDSQDSFFELTQRPEPKVKMSMYAPDSGLEPACYFDQQACCGEKLFLDIVILLVFEKRVAAITTVQAFECNSLGWLNI